MDRQHPEPMLPRFRVFKNLLAVYFILIYILLTMQPAIADNQRDRFLIDGFTWIEEVTPAEPEGVTSGLGRYDYLSGNLRVRCEISAPLNNPTIPLPTLVICHGGVTGITWRMREKALELASQGYLVAMPSYRGEDGSDGEVEIAAGEVDDVLACMNLLRNSTLVDSSRLAIIGSSHGALIGALAASRDNSIPALVCAYGVMDINSWWNYLVDAGLYEDDEISRRIYGEGPDDRPDEFFKRSAIAHACSIASPVLLIQGADDRLVPPSQAQAMVKAFESCGKTDFSFRIYNKAGHGFLWWFERDSNKKSPEALNSASQAWSDIIDFLNESWGSKP